MPTIKRTYLATALMFGAIAVSAMPAHAELAASGEPPAAKQAWRAVTVAEGVRQPWVSPGWAMAARWSPARRAGLHILNGQKFDEVALEGMPKVFTGGQGGLLDIVLHPQDVAKTASARLHDGGDRHQRGESHDPGAGRVRWQEGNGHQDSCSRSSTLTRAAASISARACCGCRTALLLMSVGRRRQSAAGA